MSEKKTKKKDMVNESTIILHSALYMAVNEVSEYVFDFKAQCVLLNSTRNSFSPRGVGVTSYDADRKIESTIPAAAYTFFFHF